MGKEYKINDQALVKSIKKGAVGVLPTDTLYGLVASALRKKSVERVYDIRERKLNKPCIVLISSLSDLKLFGIKLDKKTKEILKRVWPGKVSVVFPCSSKKYAYLYRGTKSLAVRLPKKKELVKLLKKTGPLIAPSANFEGLMPATTVREARDFFEDMVDFYVSGGKLHSLPSTVVSIKNGKLTVKRPGVIAVKI